MHRWLVPTFLLLFARPAAGSNALSLKDGGLRYWNGTFEVWGIELGDWARVADDAAAMRETFQRYSDRGVNTVGYALQQPQRPERFFDANGDVASKEAAARFTRMTRLVRDHSLASVVSLFSADRGQWLASAEAYRKAAATAARLVDEKHSVIFVVGDLFGATPWPADCPYPMNDPAKAIELCRVIQQANPEVLVAIPASTMQMELVVVVNVTALLHIGATADALQRLLPDTRPHNGRVVTDSVIVPADRFLRLRDCRGEPAKAVAQYLDTVEQRRLAIRAPMPPATGPASDELLGPQERAAGWVPLFDGRTLAGWTTLRQSWDGWSVRDGAIHCAGTSGQWLRTRQRYASFILRFEYKISKNGNSGVFVWSPLEGRSSRFGMEMQIRGVIKGQPDDDTTGAIYDVLPPREDASKPPGTWNQVEITCRGSKVTIKVNDRVVQDIDAAQVPKLQDRLRRGVIGLQDHGNEVWFRRIRIREPE